MRKLLLVAILSAMFGENVTQEQLDKGNKKCLAGEFRTCGTLGELYQYGIFGVAQDFAKAVKFYEMACDGGYFSSCTNLGFMYYEAQGVKADYKRAKELFSKACDNANALGCVNLGAMYEHGRGVPQDMAKAAAYYRLTCEAGVRLGCHNFAIYSFNQNDKQSAKEYFKKACDLGKDDPATQNTPDNKARWQKACDMHEVLR
ncbi:tetratricopeptide repeat protein [Campylobacter sp. 1BO]|uniref:tetratricopeptide repeat protein n=1 Tax=Campylobacter sp. 1BO TaxID=3424760 RepID=UPI003D33898E